MTEEASSLNYDLSVQKLSRFSLNGNSLSSDRSRLPEDIPSDFKLQWLNTTLKFIKNDKETILKYPELPSYRIKFLKSMINGFNGEIDDKQLYAPLWEALQILGLKYEFKILVERTGVDCGHLYLQKIPKTPDKIDIGISDHDTSLSSTSTEDKQKKIVQNKKFFESMKKTIESISPLYIKNTLNAIFDFVKDEQQASYVFGKLARVEAQFVQNFQAILKRRDILEDLFSPICNNLLEKIAQGLKKNTTFRLELSGTTKDEETSRRQMILQKVPHVPKTKSKTKKAKKKQTPKEEKTQTKPEENIRESDASKLLRSLEVSTKKIEQNKKEPVIKKPISFVPTDVIDSTETNSNQNTTNLHQPITKQNQPSTHQSLPNCQQTINQSQPNTNLSQPKSNLTQSNGNQIQPDSNQQPTSNLSQLTNQSQPTSSQLRPITKQTPQSSLAQTQPTNMQQVLKKLQPTLKSIPEPSLVQIKASANLQQTLNQSQPAINQSQNSGSTLVQTSNANLQPSTNQQSNPQPAINQTPGLSLVQQPALQPSINQNEPKLVEKLSTDTISKDIMEKEILPIEKPAKKKPTAEDLPTMSSEKAIVTKGLPKGKVKLIEALSTPIESDIGSRMMRLMGWEGGALGLREGGITEPIMPDLLLAPKAGLGHVEEVKLPPQSKKSRIEIRKQFLEGLLNAIKENIPVSFVDFQFVVNKKEKCFIDNTKIAFNKRKQVSASEKEQVFVDTISDYFRKNSHVKINITFVSKKQIKIEILQPNVKAVQNILIKCPNQIDNQNAKEVSFQPLIKSNPNQATNSQQEPISNRLLINQKTISQSINQATNNQPLNNQTNQPCINRLIINQLNQETNKQEPTKTNDEITENQILSLLEAKESEKITKKMLQKLKLRVFIMKSCLDFLKSGSENMDFSYKLTPKYINFIVKFCMYVNRKQPGELKYSIEKYIWEEIMENVGDYFIIPFIGTKDRYFGFKKTSSITRNENIDPNAGNIQNNVTKPKKKFNTSQEIVEKLGTSINSNTIVKIDLDSSTDSEKSFTDFKSGNTSYFNIRIIQQIGKRLPVEVVQKIQKRIYNNIPNLLPVLKCHGVHKDSLIYTCFNKETYDFLMNNFKDFQIIQYETGKLYKMSANLKFFEGSLVHIKRWLKLYHNLDAEKWEILDIFYYYDNTEFYAKMDEKSFDYICRNNFRLHLGVDEINFEIIL